MVRTEDDPLSFLDSDTASAAILRPGPSRGAGPHHPAGRPRAPPPRVSVVTTPLNVVRQRGVAEQALPESLSLPTAKFFADGQGISHRQRTSLPTARARHRQRILCRVPGRRQRLALGKGPLYRRPGSRQRKALGKVGPGQTAADAVPFAESHAVRPSAKV